MIHARPDYNRIQDPATKSGDVAPGSTPIGASEPVILFRAQDKHFVAVLQHFADRVAFDREISPEQKTAILDAIEGHIVLAREWQSENGTKSPDVPLTVAMQPSAPRPEDAEMVS